MLLTSQMVVGFHKPCIPVFICLSCGVHYGKRPCGTATLQASPWHYGVCDVCHKAAKVSSIKNFKYLKEYWEYKKGIQR